MSTKNHTCIQIPYSPLPCSQGLSTSVAQLVKYHTRVVKVVGSIPTYILKFFFRGTGKPQDLYTSLVGMSNCTFDHDNVCGLEKKKSYFC